MWAEDGAGRGEGQAEDRQGLRLEKGRRVGLSNLWDQAQAPERPRVGACGGHPGLQTGKFGRGCLSEREASPNPKACSLHPHSSPLRKLTASPLYRGGNEAPGGSVTSPNLTAQKEGTPD